MKLLLAAYRLQQARPAAGVMGVHLFTDGPLPQMELEWRQMTAPWAEWAPLRQARPLSSLSNEAAVAAAGVQPGDAVVTITRNLAAVAPLRPWIEARGAAWIVPEFYAQGSRDGDMAREVFHFDFEFGGLNEFNGAATLHGATCLRQLSSTHCITFYPAWALGALVEQRRRAGRLPLKALDVGCGPVSLLRWGALHGELSITGVDPLLPMYAVVLARHGYDTLPKIRCDREIAGLAEDLDRHVAAGSFDVVYSRNALDHTLRPGHVIEQMGRCLTPGGIAVVEVATREGTRQNWDQFHQTDVYVRDGVVVYCHQDGVERPLLSPESGLRLKHIQVNSEEWLACTLEKV